MRILIVHSRYLSGPASGENAVVADEARLLMKGGHTVELWQPSPKRVTGLGLISTAIDATWSRDAIARIRAAIRDLQPEIVHFHNLFPTISPAALRVTAEHGAAPVMTLHNYRLMCLPSTFLRDGRVCEDCLGRTAPWPGLLHRCYRGSLPGSVALAASLSLHRAIGTFDEVALYLPVSEFVRRKYVEAGLPVERLRVKSNFTWPVARREGAGDHFLFVGRVSPEKGVRTLVQAWKDSYPRLLILGDGPDAPHLKNAATANVEFVGVVPPERVVEFIRRARALLVPSVWYEAQPRVILEAYAAGVPVVASRIGGLPDLVVDGESGLLVSPSEPTAWSRAVARLGDESEAQRLGDGAYQLWAERYSPDHGLHELVDSYREARSRAGVA